MGFPGGASGKEPGCQCRRRRDVGSVLGWGRSLGGGHDNPLQYSCLENPMDRGARRATVHRVGESDTTWHAHACTLVTVLFAEHYKTYIAVSASLYLYLSLSLSLYTSLKEQINTTTPYDHFIKKERELLKHGFLWVFSLNLDCDFFIWLLIFDHLLDCKQILYLSRVFTGQILSRWKFGGKNIFMWEKK